LAHGTAISTALPAGLSPVALRAVTVSTTTAPDVAGTVFLTPEKGGNVVTGNFGRAGNGTDVTGEVQTGGVKLWCG
jgi:hypothetical protein